MASEPGQNGGDSTTTIGYSDASDTTEAGDAVGITGGEIEPGTDTENLLGVRARGRATENSGIAPVHVGGPTVAAVEGSVSEGDDLDLGTTGADGELETSSGGPAHALSDAGGSWRGQDAPAGYAWVLL
ncbi:hypothetical protein [Natronorubrum halophilum]|uniref:hypothetical protein n=1 Tax=Natronorubrum halophilum TaxID=1702106 RepID=UPI0010C16FE3|nr:hypothetical protein [Natronorubrum halophilum]